MSLTSPLQTNDDLFFIVDIIRVMDSDADSVQMKYIGEGANTREYALKDPTPEEPYIPAVELFCYELCKLLNIPTPEYDVVRMPSGELTFGSLWNSSAQSTGILMQRLIMSGKDSAFFSMVGKIYGVDLLVNNIDRHTDNYLLTPNKTTTSALAMDFGRALFNTSFKGLEATNPNYATNKNQKIFAKLGIHNHHLSEEILDKTLQIDKSRIEQIFTKMPPEWLPEILKQEFLAWWGSQEFIKRIAELKSRGLSR